MDNNITDNIDKLAVQNISKNFITNNKKSTLFLNDISFEVPRGICVGVLGYNGSGKSTLMSIIAHMQPFDKGSITMNGTPVGKNEKLKIAYVPQSPILLDNLSVEDNIRIWHSGYKLDNFKETLDNMPKCLSINDLLKKKIKSLSGGMQKKVSIAIALLNNPHYIILDEAFASLDYITIIELTELLIELKQGGMGIIYSSHNISEIKQLCDKIIVLKKGNIKFMDDFSNIPKENIEQFLYQYF